jgi:hypothetical protein
MPSRAVPTWLAFAALLLAGCSGAAPETGSAPDATPVAMEADALPASAADRLELRDCWVMRSFMPVDYAEAQALLPPDLSAASWIEPGDRTLAMLDLLYLECGQGTAGEAETGPAAALFFEIPLEVQGALSGSNVFPVLTVHTNPAVAGFWQGKWVSQAGSLVRSPSPQGTSTALGVVAGALTGVLEAKVPEAVSGTGEASFQQVFDGPQGRREVTAALTNIHVALGGTAEFVGVGLPVTLPHGVPLTPSAGFAVANGPLESIVFSVPPAPPADA